MITVVNFSHPLTEEQLAQIEAICKDKVGQVFEARSFMDEYRDFESQVDEMISQIPLTPEAWQRERILVNLPGYSPACAVMLATLGGLMGYLPTIIRLRPAKDVIPPIFEVAELINLQSVRDRTRKMR